MIRPRIALTALCLSLSALSAATACQPARSSPAAREVPQTNEDVHPVATSRPARPNIDSELATTARIAGTAPATTALRPTPAIATPAASPPPLATAAVPPAPSPPPLATAAVPPAAPLPPVAPPPSVPVALPSLNGATLLTPAKATVHAPDKFQVRFHTTKGDFVLEAVRSWAPHGVDRFYALVRLGYFSDIAIYRVVKKPDAPNDFMAQFGIHGTPAVAAKWEHASIPDDPVAQSNLGGFASFAATGQPNSRATQIFINYTSNSFLDRSGFAPFARVVSGWNAVRAFYSGYGESPSRLQREIAAQGNDLLHAQFPLLDYILSAEVISASSVP